MYVSHLQCLIPLRALNICSSLLLERSVRRTFQRLAETEGIDMDIQTLRQSAKRAEREQDKLQIPIVGAQAKTSCSVKRSEGWE